MPHAVVAGPSAEYRITRILDAPRAVVFEAWTDPRLMAHWWGPHEFTNPVCELDPRAGGAYRIVMRTAGGGEFPLTGEYLEVAEPERLRLTVDCSGHAPAWHDLVNAHGGTGRANALGGIEQIVTFENLDGRTKLTVRMRFESSSVRDAMVTLGMDAGWRESLDCLAACLAACDEAGEGSPIDIKSLNPETS